MPPCEQRFLVTGASGFIGAWVVKNLVERGNRPILFDLERRLDRLEALVTEGQLGSLQFFCGDITASDQVERLIADQGVTHVIHLAALQVPACAGNPVLGAKVNVLGTLNIFEAARRHRDLVQQIVYASSAAVYGPEEFYGVSKVPSDAPLHPGTHYGVFKQCNEGNARVYYQSEGISSVGLRPWTVYGVGRDLGLTSGPTKAIKAAVVGQPYIIGFTGATDLQYADDCAQIFLRAAEENLAGARVYTMRGTVIRIEDFIAALERVYPPAVGLIRAEGKHLPIAPDLDDSALRRDFPDLPHTPLEEGIRQTVAIFERLRRAGRLEVRDLES